MHYYRDKQSEYPHPSIDLLRLDSSDVEGSLSACHTCHYIFALQDFPAYPPEAVEVRNTFIHVASPSAEAADRPVLSCPASKIGWIEHGQIEQGWPSSPSPASLSPVQKQDPCSGTFFMHQGEIT